MDRNAETISGGFFVIVALRKESVDRNIVNGGIINRSAKVALRKESVDRNISNTVKNYRRVTSLSARRAWIEINSTKLPTGGQTSLSARRAWIEIQGRRNNHPGPVCRSPQGERG